MTVQQRFRETWSAYDLPPPSFDADLVLVTRGTSMGELLRRYWHPVCTSLRLRDLPVQVRALGEDIVLFRKPSGAVGALYPRCVHRGASLLYGRPTDEGLRCPYHAWTFEPDGRCTAQPCEPDRGRGRGVVRQPWYPAQELYGFVFVYLGPLDRMPPLPRYDLLESIPDGWEIVADDTTIPSGGAGHMPCNWLQHHENGMDPHHVAVVHEHQFPPIMAQAESTYSFEQADDRVRGRGLSKIGPSLMDFRVEMPTPNIRIIPNPLLPEPRPDGKADSVAWTVPLDDTNTVVFTALVQQIGAEPAEFERYNGKAWTDLSFEEHQRYPGDFETQVGQGPITLHSEEHLVSSDKGIVFLRRNLQSALADVAEGRDPPLAFGPPSILVQTTSGVVMSANPDFVAGTTPVPDAAPPGAAPPAVAPLAFESPAIVPEASAAAVPPGECWALTLTSPMGEQHVTLRVTRAGSTLTGVMEGDDGPVAIQNGRAEGDRLSWKAGVRKPIPLTLKFDVAVTGDSLVGTFKPGMFPAAKVTGTRA